MTDSPSRSPSRDAAGSRSRTRRHRGGRRRSNNNVPSSGLPGVDDFDDVIRERVIAEGEEDSAPPKPDKSKKGGSGLPGIDDFDAVIAARAEAEDGGDGGRGGVPAIPPNDPKLRTGEWGLVKNQGTGLPGYDEFDDVIEERMEREGEGSR
ncbi:hypothetical protein E1B28_005673 [Marasmius oreades]|uniref:Uncharacterized protein n=1 Tax=Marasmius oreades TaxID=181124 RepID=A0A9P7S541_9AGAR|nr:uncharacterized protein E1B28_005673 [Marasmius oreades]KAG7094866.1 hypothetical protein E1B28_005673 [Marasmius oreades]